MFYRGHVKYLDFLLCRYLKAYMINSETKLYCLFGNPVSGSLSPALQNSAFASEGINAVYMAFKINSIIEGVKAMRELNISGASVTVPFKQEVMKYIDETDPLAEDIGAVNTLLNDNGTVKGFNTDGYGAVKALMKAGMEISGASFLILGNGGAARAVSFALLSQGGKVQIAGRNPLKAGILAGDLSVKYSGVASSSLEELNQSNCRKFDCVINATTAGMFPAADSEPVSADILSSGQMVFDIVYKPDETLFLKHAGMKGCRVLKGFEMLLHQGTAQFEIWTGRPAPEKIMRDAAEKFLVK